MRKVEEIRGAKFTARYIENKLVNDFEIRLKMNSPQPEPSEYRDINSNDKIISQNWE
ncbi:hypothetical protein K0M31_003822 [Melipona bicolor]|uniref:Uncharacterized protein n=1 Tax=Melipona bicolor TaxID=60889 RepID=A0AA40FXM1_9HYME|nr:hypothetical protein K0M31_003822 [Melipona bicolor]